MVRSGDLPWSRNPSPVESRVVRSWSAYPVVISVAVDNDASLESTVIEVRAADEIGLLHRLTSCLFSCGLDVDAARVATIGGEVIDAFYVRSPEGSKLEDPLLLSQVTERVRAVLRGAGGGAAL